MALDDVRESNYWLRIEYNEERPYDALGDLISIEARNQSANSTNVVSR